MELPQDAMILLSYINTQLRDHYATLDELCAALEVSRTEIEEKLQRVDYTYDPQRNAFL